MAAAQKQTAVRQAPRTVSKAAFDRFVKALKDAPQPGAKLQELIAATRRHG